MRVHRVAYHPDLGSFMSCKRCWWCYGFAPTLHARAAGLWHAFHCKGGTR